MEVSGTNRQVSAGQSFQTAEAFMDSDFVYENAPLGEVVAELFWKLTPVTSLPGAAVDPHFETTLAGFSSGVAKLGFASTERLVPLGVPLELIPAQPISRFRQKENNWPLYQLGPGVFTCNVVPPYGGWGVFRNTLSEGISALFDSYPAASTQLKVTILRVRYINGFDETHGFRGNPLAFFQSHLGMRVNLPAQLLVQLRSSDAQIVPTYEMTIPTTNGREVMLKAGVGAKDKRPALIFELWVTQKDRPPSEAQAIREWFDAAHDVLHDAFESMLTEEARKYIGKKLPAGTQ